VAAAIAMRIRWTPLAEQDLEAAYDYVQQDNENAARRLVERILSGVGMLSRHPFAGR
jgi:plasmid stabilization system protein ParE